MRYTLKDTMYLFFGLKTQNFWQYYAEKLFLLTKSKQYKARRRRILLNLAKQRSNRYFKEEFSNPIHILQNKSSSRAN